MTISPVAPELREVEKRPFGIYAIIGLFLVVATGAALDILRIRSGYPRRLVEQIAIFLRDGTTLNALSHWLVRDDQILLFINIAIIGLTLTTSLGLWFRRQEAWVASMILVGIGLGFNIWVYLVGKPLFFSMLINVSAVFYFNERSVQLSFERGQPAGEAS